MDDVELDEFEQYAADECESAACFYREVEIGMTK